MEDPVVVPDFILDLVAPGPTLPSLDAPGAGCICAEAIVVAPNSEATTRAEIASLDRMKNLLLGWMMLETKLATRVSVPDAATFGGDAGREPRQKA